MKKALIFVASVFLAIFLYYAIDLAIARSQTEEKFSSFLSSEQAVLTIEDLSDYQLKALLKVEDPAFYEHNGLDINTPGAGITTITQAIVKRLYFDEFKQGLPKIRQTIIAMWAVDSLVSKEDQLNTFLNIVPFNKGGVGFSEASQYYYGKEFHELTNDEYLSLLAMLIAPRQYDIKDFPEKNQERVRRIKLVLDGKYAPRGNSDYFYEGAASIE